MMRENNIDVQRKEIKRNQQTSETSSFANNHKTCQFNLCKESETSLLLRNTSTGMLLDERQRGERKEKSRNKGTAFSQQQ